MLDDEEADPSRWTGWEVAKEGTSLADVESSDVTEHADGSTAGRVQSLSYTSDP